MRVTLQQLHPLELGGCLVGVLLVIKEIKQNSTLALGAFGVRIILRKQHVHVASKTTNEEHGPYLFIGLRRHA